jgi:hypothetical protein
MNDRNKFIIAFRGETLGALNSETLSDEIFQNQTLRPILKLQNNIYLEVFKNYISKSKLDFSNFSIEKKMQFIENSIQKDINFQNILKGISIGLFTVEEYLIYSKNSSNLNKRLMSMLIERLKSQIQLF